MRLLLSTALLLPIAAAAQAPAAFEPPVALVMPVSGEPVAPAGPAIGRLLRSEIHAEGCGCSFYAPGDAPAGSALLLRVNADGRAAMRLDGEPVAMRKTGEKVVRRSRKTLTAGDKLLLTLRGRDAQASVNAALDRSCRVAEGCRSLSYRSLIAVSRGGTRSTVPAWGVCGC